MAKKEEILKTIIVFLFFLFGCSSKYVDDEGRSLDEKIVASWEELDCKIVKQNEQGFSMGLRVRDVIVVGDSIKAVELYKGKSLGKSDLPLLGAAVGFFGCLGGFYYVRSQDYEILPSEEQLGTGCFISGVSCLTGFAMMLGGIRKGDGSIGVMPDFIKRDTVCVDSVLLSRQKIKISVEKTGFEEIYWTDRGGNVGLKFDEIIPEPTESDSIINLIIQYEDLADSIKVRRL